MAKYIKREEALRAVHGQRGPCRSPAQNRMLDYLRTAIMRVPAVDAVEVVRCRDCESAEESDNHEYVICCNLGVGMAKDDYCSHGVRKDGGAGK